jgi:hypothetical protein
MASNSIPVNEKGNVLVEGTNFFKAVAGQRQYTGFLDSDHGVVEIWETVGKEENIKALSEAGVKHLFLEQKRERQNEVAAYYRGEVSETELSEKARSFSSWAVFDDDEIRQGQAVVDMIVHSKKYGMQVHFSDPQSEIFYDGSKFLLRADHPLYKSDPGAAEALNKLRSIENIDKQLDYSLSLSSDLQRRMDELSIKIGQAKMEERLTMNEDLASFIVEKTNGEKAAILYGGLHFDQLKDLDEYLGPESITTIALLSSPDQDSSKFETPIRDLPDYAYFIDEQRATQKQTICKDIAKEAASQIGIQLSGAGVQICESTLDMGVYHTGSIKEEVQMKR